MAAKHDEPNGFIGYEKMGSDTNLWSTRKLDSIKTWVALEKVHGANFSFHVSQSSESDGQLDVKVAKRTSYLKDGEQFYQIHKQAGFIEGEIEKAKQLFTAVNETVAPGVLVVTVYGELFGGSYPHPSVPPCPTAARVQREVLYCPDQKFLAYDIAIQETDATLDSKSRRKYLDYDVCMDLFKACGFLYAEPLITGTLQDMLNYPLGFETTYPAKFGLPPLADQKNVAEGIVIKPLKDSMLESVRANNKLMRVIFKRKVDEFTERRPQMKERKQQKKQSGFNQDLETLKYEGMALIVEQRLVNTVSKYGLPDPAEESCNEQWKVITTALVDDVMEELKSENEGEWGKISTEVNLVKKLRGLLRKECGDLVREYREKL